VKLVNYDKFKKRSPRETMFFAILFAVLCGVMIGMVLMQIALGRGVWTWGLGSVWAALIGLESLQWTFATLRKYSPSSTETQPNRQKAA